MLKILLQSSSPSWELRTASTRGRYGGTPSAWLVSEDTYVKTPSVGRRDHNIRTPSSSSLTGLFEETCIVVGIQFSFIITSTSKAFNKCVDPCPRYLRWHTQSLRLLFGQGARTRCPWGENLCATSSTFAGRRHMIGKVVTGCVAILSYHTATQDRGSECRDFGFISRIVTALLMWPLPLPSVTHLSSLHKSPW